MSHSVSFSGHTYRTGGILTLPTYEQESVFGQVVHLFPMVDKNVLFGFLRILNVKYFDD